MRDSKKGVLVLGLTVAALCAPVSSGFAQAHTRMSGPPQPPKTTTNADRNVAAEIDRLHQGFQYREGQSVRLRDSAQRRRQHTRGQRHFRGQRRQRRQRRFQGPCGKFRRGVRLYSRQQGLEAAGLP